MAIKAGGKYEEGAKEKINQLESSLRKYMK